MNPNSVQEKSIEINQINSLQQPLIINQKPQPINIDLNPQKPRKFEILLKKL